MYVHEYKYTHTHTHKRGVEMNGKYEKLTSMIKAMDKEERAVVLSCIPIVEMLEYVNESYLKLQDIISQIENITKGE